LAARLSLPAHTEVHHLSEVLTLPVRAGTGRAGETVMAVAMFSALLGAAFETALATGYMVAQYRRWSWSMDDRLSQSSRFFAVTAGTLLVSGAVMSFGVDVFTITDYSLVLSTVVPPFTYWPVWRAARDRDRMQDHATGRVLDVAGAAGLVLVGAVALCAVPAMVLGG
ncbi:MAG TPA: divalent metal cation transporter, partial [Acidimicrobiales bacterium]|nr:divalent metal cation transporter [Acidimicrobiales bacterium]